MKLNVDFSSLHECIDRMGALDSDFSLDVKFDSIDIQLDSGIDINLTDIENTEGILSYKGRQVLLYIPDQGGNIAGVFENPENGRRFHVADCSTLKQMRERNRFDRYVVTNNLSGIFKVSGVDNITGQHLEGEAGLKVCKNCLKSLNYDGYAIDIPKRNSIFNAFSINTFFETYSTVFKFLPKRSKGIYAANYSKDWKEISKKYRNKMNYICERCHTDFSHNKNLLHTHHISGVKSDNRDGNLKALCADCHRKEPMHEHIFIDHDDMLKIYELRRLQGKITTNSWNEIFKLADTSLHGYLKYVQNSHSEIPELGYIIGHNGKKIVLDLAWPHKKVAVVIAKNSLNTSLRNWTILSLGDEMIRLNKN